MANRIGRFPFLLRAKGVFIDITTLTQTRTNRKVENSLDTTKLKVVVQSPKATKKSDSSQVIEHDIEILTREVLEDDTQFTYDDITYKISGEIKKPLADHRIYKGKHFARV